VKRPSDRVQAKHERGEVEHRKRREEVAVEAQQVGVLNLRVGGQILPVPNMASDAKFVTAMTRAIHQGEWDISVIRQAVGSAQTTRLSWVPTL